MANTFERLGIEVNLKLGKDFGRVLKKIRSDLNSINAKNLTQFATVANNLTASLTKTSASLEKTVTSTTKLANSANKLSTGFKDTGKAADDAGKKTNQFSKNMKSLTLHVVQVMAIRRAFMAVSTAIGTAVGQALDLNQTMAEVGAISNASSSDLAKFEEAAIAIGSSSKFTAVEVAATMKILAQAGVEAAQLATATQNVEFFATGTGSGAVEATKAFTTAMRVWNIEGEETNRIANVLTASMNNSKLTTSDMSTAFNYLANQSEALGIGLEETSAIIATMTNRGMRASTVGTGMAGVLVRLSKPTARIAELLESVGLTTEDVNPQLHEFADILDTMSDAGITATDVLGTFERRTGRALVTALDAGGEAFRRMKNDITDTDSSLVAYTRTMDGARAKLNVLQSELLASVSGIGKDLAAPLNAALIALSDLAVGIGEPLGKAVAGIGLLVVALGALVAAFSFVSAATVAAVAPWAAALGLVALAVGAIGHEANSAKREMHELLKVWAEQESEIQRTKSAMSQLNSELERARKSGEDHVVLSETLKTRLSELTDQYPHLSAAAKATSITLDQGTAVYERTTKAVNDLKDAQLQAQIEIYNKKAIDIESKQSSLRLVDAQLAQQEQLLESRSITQALASEGRQLTLDHQVLQSKRVRLNDEITSLIAQQKVLEASSTKSRRLELQDDRLVKRKTTGEEGTEDFVGPTKPTSTIATLAVETARIGTVDKTTASIFAQKEAEDDLAAAIMRVATARATADERAAGNVTITQARLNTNSEEIAILEGQRSGYQDLSDTLAAKHLLSDREDKKAKLYTTTIESLTTKILGLNTARQDLISTSIKADIDYDAEIAKLVKANDEFVEASNIIAQEAAASQAKAELKAYEDTLSSSTETMEARGEAFKKAKLAIVAKLSAEEDAELAEYLKGKPSDADSAKLSEDAIKKAVAAEAIVREALQKKYKAKKATAIAGLSTEWNIEVSQQSLDSIDRATEAERSKLEILKEQAWTSEDLYKLRQDDAELTIQNLEDKKALYAQEIENFSILESIQVLNTAQKQERDLLLETEKAITAEIQAQKARKEVDPNSFAGIKKGAKESTQSFEEGTDLQTLSSEVTTTALGGTTSAITDMIQALKEGENAWESFKSSLANVANEIVAEIEKMVIKFLILAAVKQIAGYASPSVQTAGLSKTNISTAATGGYFDGNTISNYAAGGIHVGSGPVAADAATVGVDSINAMIMPGEFVMKRAAVDYYGLKKMTKLNQMRFAEGGSSGGAGDQSGDSDKADADFVLNIINVVDPNSIPRTSDTEIINVIQMDAAKNGPATRTLREKMSR